MQPEELVKRLQAENKPTVVDVRSSMEFNSGHIPGALHLPNWKILLHLGTLPADKKTELVVICEHGPRAQLAQGILAANGYRNTCLLTGHMSRWRQLGLPLQK